MSKVKICGLTKLADIHAVNEYLPDYAGFILSQPYRRYVDIANLAFLRKQLNHRIRAVGVFVNEAPEYIFKYLEQDLIDIVQLHGNEDNDFILEIKREYPFFPLIRSFEIHDEKDIRSANLSLADLVLLDAGKGSGKTFDWNLLAGMKRPYILAGGLNPDNISKALAKCDPFAVDTSSGVETNGNKDPEKIKAFIAAVRKEQGVIL